MKNETPFEMREKGVSQQSMIMIALVQHYYFLQQMRDDTSMTIEQTQRS